MRRSEHWFNDKTDPGQTAIYVERFLNYGITIEELQSGKPVVGICQIGSDITPCNRVHLQTVERARDGVRDAGGLPMVFPMHPLQESCKRPTAALDRNLAYLGLVEILHGYPFDSVILTTGCDKTTPAALMAAATVNIPAIVLSGGPMLDGYYNGELAGSGVMLWEARKLLAEGEIDYNEFMEMIAATTNSVGHCNTMGTALTMNSLAESLGMSLPGCGAIPAAYRERMQYAFLTGKRSVEIVHEDLTPDKILTRQAFENAIAVNTAIGGSTNAPPHLNAIARHVGVELSTKDWQTIGYEVPLLVNCQPAGKYLGEAFHRAGGVPAVISELIKGDRIHVDAMTITGKTLGENLKDSKVLDGNVIFSYDQPIKENAGFIVLSGNLFESALIKTCVINEKFRERFLSTPDRLNCFEARAVVFDGPEDYRKRINDPKLGVDESCILVIRNCGPVGFPGSAEVVNMQPPDQMISDGFRELPTMGDGRQSGTCASPSILNASPESAIGGNLALLKTGDRIEINLNTASAMLLVTDEELEKRRTEYVARELHHQTPWQELYRNTVGQLDSGACMELAVKYRDVGKDIPRHGH